MTRFATPLFALVTDGSRANRRVPDRGVRLLIAVLARPAAALRRFNRDNIALWEAHARAQRPWEYPTGHR